MQPAQTTCGVAAEFATTGKATPDVQVQEAGYQMQLSANVAGTRKWQAVKNGVAASVQPRPQSIDHMTLRIVSSID